MLGPGEMFGEEALSLLPRPLAGYTAEAATDVELEACLSFDKIMMLDTGPSLDPWTR